MNAAALDVLGEDLYPVDQGPCQHHGGRDEQQQRQQREDHGGERRPSAAPRDELRVGGIGRDGDDDPPQRRRHEGPDDVEDQHPEHDDRT